MALLYTVLSVTLLAGATQTRHPLESWRSIVKGGYAVPDGADIQALTMELSELLASPDPEQRDEIGYSTFAAWIYQKRTVGPDTVRALAIRLLENLKHGLGEQGTDTVFRRSFSVLVLSVIVARDNVDPVLSRQEFRRVHDAALGYLQGERDLRGYDEQKGWMHSAAHTADLLKFVARSRHLEVRDQAQILDAIASKLADARMVFTHGEDERFARAILSIVNRADFDRAGFEAWVTRSTPAVLRTTRPTTAQLSARQNVNNLFSKLAVLLSADAQPSESIVVARDAIRTGLKGAY